MNSKETIKNKCIIFEKKNNNNKKVVTKLYALYTAYTLLRVYVRDIWLCGQIEKGIQIPRRGIGWKEQQHHSFVHLKPLCDCCRVVKWHTVPNNDYMYQDFTSLAYLHQLVPAYHRGHPKSIRCMALWAVFVIVHNLKWLHSYVVMLAPLWPRTSTVARLPIKFLPLRQLKIGFVYKDEFIWYFPGFKLLDSIKYRKAMTQTTMTLQNFFFFLKFTPCQ